MSITRKFSIQNAYIVSFLFSYLFYNTKMNISPLLQSILTFVCVGLFGLWILRSKYQIKTIIIYMVILLIGLISYITTGMSVFLLIILGMVMLDEKNVEYIVKILFFLRVVAFIITASASLLGIIDNSSVRVYKSGVYISKMDLGFNHPNQLGQALGIIILLYICIKYEKKSVNYRLIELVMIGLSYIISGSRTMAVCCLLFLVYSSISSNKYMEQIINKIIIRYRWAIMGMILILGIGMPILMTKLSGKGLEYLYLLNGVLGSRFSFASAVINNYKLTMFGNVFDFSYLETLYGKYAVDNSYINVLYGFGIISIIVLVFFSMRAIKYFGENKKEKYAALIMILLFWGCFENILFIPTVNVGILLLGVGFSTQKRKYMIGKN